MPLLIGSFQRRHGKKNSRENKGSERDGGTIFSRYFPRKTMKELSVLCLVKPAGNIAGKNASRKAQQVISIV
jgi:hypothetical protein